MRPLKLKIPARLRGPLKYAGYVAFAVGSFLTAVYLTFPYERAKDRIEAELATSRDYAVTIGRLGPSPLFGIAASNVIIERRTPSGEKAGLRIAIERVRVSVSPLLLAFGRRQIDFSLRAFDGTISGSYRDVKGDLTLQVKLAGVRLAALPLLKDAFTLPLTGAISGEVDLALPAGKLVNATGVVELSCDKCSVGDGKARLQIPAAAGLFASGVLVDKVSLGQFGGRLVIEQGAARFERFAARSADGDIVIEGEIGLADPIGSSSLKTTYLSFRPSESCRKKQPFSMLDIALGATAKRPDGFFGFRVSGSLAEPKFAASKVSPVTPPRHGGPAVTGGPRRFEGGAMRSRGPAGPTAPGLRGPAPPGAFASGVKGAPPVAPTPAVPAPEPPPPTERGAPAGQPPPPLPAPGPAPAPAPVPPPPEPPEQPPGQPPDQPPGQPGPGPGEPPPSQ